MLSARWVILIALVALAVAATLFLLLASGSAWAGALLKGSVIVGETPVFVGVLGVGTAAIKNDLCR